MKTKLSIISLTALAIGLTAPAISAQETRGFQANRYQIAETRRIAKRYYAKYFAREDAIADAIDSTCQAAKIEGSLENLTSIRLTTMQKLDRQGQLEILDFYLAVDVIALSSVCPEYRYVLKR
ncbi:MULTISPECIES: hypothetical protein [Leptolyngbya]|uniref:hypothetical protein n=1 Tax=Leptolyngbya TaxID=47251 RepID=UPI001685EFF9|nr:hypothetical protein [Leptolyngbya sp. FACHB-1624]MBD1856460.1 hypothetical protein [Leptolyngbya sp. FACHB-1624]